MVGLEVAVPYHRYARVLRWLALSLLAYVGVLAVVHVDWAAALVHTVAPRFQLDRASLAALLAVFGTTISPYLFFWQAGEEVEEQAAGRGVDRDRRYGRRAVHPGALQVADVQSDPAEACRREPVGERAGHLHQRGAPERERRVDGAELGDRGRKVACGRQRQPDRQPGPAGRLERVQDLP